MFRSRPSTPLALPLFKCLNEFAMLAPETLQENSVILVNSLDTSLFKSQLFTLFNKDSYYFFHILQILSSSTQISTVDAKGFLHC